MKTVTETASTPVAYDLKTAAWMAGNVSCKHLVNLAKRGELRLTRLGRRIVISREELLRFLAENTEDAR